jgi:hypothetical protein
MKKVLFISMMALITHVGMAQNTKSKAAHTNDAKGDPNLPTYLVDGVEMPYAKVVKLNTALIASMDVYKGPDAVAKFDPKYKHGLVVVKLKKGKKK